MQTTHKCAHCQLTYPLQKLKRTQDSQGKELYFCCNGCENVYFLLQNAGFGGFYERLGSNVLTPITQQTLKNNQQYVYLDEPHFITNNTTKKDNLREVSIIIEGIHCAACVWLNENMLGLERGIYKTHINYTNNKAKILFDPSIIGLSRIFALIESIGYRAHIYDPSTQEKQLQNTQRSFFVAFVVGVFCTMSIMMVAIAQYAGYFVGMSQDMKDVLNLVSCLLATPVLLYTGRVFFSGAYYGLKNGYVGMDFLVAFGASLTFVYSIYASITRSGETYFESVAMIILFVFSGKFLETRAKSAAGDSLDRLHSILPCVVDVESETGIQQKTKESLKIGDIVRIKPGEMLPCDGIVLQDALLDMQSLSGESMPIAKKRGDEVLSGSIALEHSFTYEVCKSYKTSAMYKIINLLEESIAHRPKIQNLANSLSKYFSRIVLLIALCGFCGWWWWDNDMQHALIVTISVIVISCPCALALATPIASVVGISNAYKNGLIFKEARFLETLARAKVVVFDKTGTLTNGTPILYATKKLMPFDENLFANFTSLSAHPISRALSKAVPITQKLALTNITQKDSRGIYAEYEGLELLGGNLKFLADSGVIITTQQELASDLNKMSVFGYSVNKQLVGVFYLQDTLKNGALELISYLKKQGKQIVLLSGDREGVVQDVAQKLHIQEWQANLLPTDKAYYIQEKIIQMRANKSNDTESKYADIYESGSVVMIGDGLNDILALQSAQVGISMGAGSDVAIAQSDIVILNDTLKGVQSAFIIATRTYQRIKQNLMLSIAYNALLIPLALAGLVIPLVAALSMSLSSLIVVGNSLRKYA